MGPAAGNDRGAPGNFNTVVTPDGMGGIIIVWQEGPYPVESHPIAGIHAQRVTRDGELLWGARGVVVCQGAGDHIYPALVADEAGGAFVAWQDSRDNSGTYLIYGQHLSAGGASLWPLYGQPLTKSHSLSQQNPMLAGQRGRGVIVAWQAGATSDSAEFLAQRVSESGRLLWVTDARISGAAHALTGLTIMQDGEGCAWFAWLDNRNPGTTDVYTQKLTLQGAVARGWSKAGNPVCSAPSSWRSRPLLAGGEGDGAYLTWLDHDSPRAARITSRGEIAEEWDTCGVVLSTSQFGGSNQIALIGDGERGAIVAWEEGAPPDGWYETVLVQHLSRGGVGRLRPGRRGGAELTAEVTGGRLEFSLHGFLRNPAYQAPTVAFSLADESPARIELFDLEGRRWVMRELGALGAGRHVVELGSDRVLPAGIYFVRLTSGGRSLAARGVVIR
jgi:hypothetical protein